MPLAPADLKSLPTKDPCGWKPTTLTSRAWKSEGRQVWTAVVAYEANSIETDLASVALMGRKDAMSLRWLVATHDSEINMTMYDLDRSFSQRLHYKFHGCFCLFKILADKKCWSLSLIASNCSHWASTKGWGVPAPLLEVGRGQGKDSERVLYTFTKEDGQIQAIILDNVQSSHRCLDPLHGLYESPSHRHLV